MDQIRVVNEYGDTSIQGVMNPVAGMVTNFGTILSVSSAGLCTMVYANSSEPHNGDQVFYAHQLMITVANATGHGWPGGADCRTFGHANEQTEFAGPPHDQSYVLIGPGGTPYTGSYGS